MRALAGLGLVFLSTFAPRDAPGQVTQVKVRGVSPIPPARVAIYTVKGRGVTVPFIAFQERARRTVEAHVHAEIVSMEETLARGGPNLSKRLAACRGEAECFARTLARALDAQLLLVITASRLGDTRLVGARWIDLTTRRVLGEAIDEVSRDQSYTDAIPDRIRRSVPSERWDPFGRLSVEVSEPGAQISLNGRVIGLSPLGTITNLLPATYRVSAQKDGYRPAERRVRIVRGRTSKVDLTLSSEDDDDGALWWIVGGAAGAVVVAAVVVGVVVATSGDDPSF